MSFGGFLGLGSDYYPIPWNTLTYDVNEGGYVVNVDRDRFSGAPSHSGDNEAGSVESGYTHQIDDDYGSARAGGF